MSLIEQKDFWDVRDLATIAIENYDIVVADEDADDVAEAKRILEMLGAALVSFNRSQFFPLTLEEHEDTHDEASFHDSSREAPEPFIYGEDIADDFGWWSEDTPDFLKNAVNWADVADTLKINSEGGKLELDGTTYWVGIS